MMILLVLATLRSNSRDVSHRQKCLPSSFMLKIAEATIFGRHCTVCKCGGHWQKVRKKLYKTLGNAVQNLLGLGKKLDWVISLEGRQMLPP